MSSGKFKQIVGLVLLASLAFSNYSCTIASSNEEFFGTTTPPSRNIFRYVTGDEPASLDPAIGNGQPEARIYMALYEGLVEYNPKTLEPEPALAERWHINNDSSEFTFHLRTTGRWSNGDPIDANDFVYSFRRALDKKTASHNVSLTLYLKYAQAVNEEEVFVRDQQTGQFLLAKDFEENPPPDPISSSPIDPAKNEYLPDPNETTPDPDTAFHHQMHTPLRLTLPGDEKSRTKSLEANPKLKAAVAGKEFVPVRPEDLGVEAVDKYTVRLYLKQPAPFFLGLLAYQVFRLVPRKVVEQWGDQWTQPEHIVTCGPFKLKTWVPYDKIVLERDPMYWDAKTVKLDELHFYPILDNATVMNLYKVGELDAVYNRAVPNPWLHIIRQKKDYMDRPEAAIDYLIMNTTKPPLDNVKVRKAFNLSIDKEAYASWRRIVKPLTAFTPEGIFAGYPQPKGAPFNPAEARRLLGEAGYPVVQNSDGSFSCPKFPVDQVEFIYNSQAANKSVAEWMQAQWKQNLGITVGLRNMEWKTFLDQRAKLEYKGFARGAFGADYMDPFTFLSIFYTSGDNGTGWVDPKYVAMLDEANRTLSHDKRYELLAKAEAYMLDNQPIIPIDSPSVNWLKKPYVKGMYPNPGSLFAWKYVYIERDRAKWDYGTPSLTAE
ncbi:MAG TPA: peptide ABC transporter substrate-binding protein [Pyrinomonadaceae bacterium]|nr:peptide ABC transporter substrate-binding protein [Pyrinomonadaceae bacterium]